MKKDKIVSYNGIPINDISREKLIEIIGNQDQAYGSLQKEHREREAELLDMMEPTISHVKKFINDIFNYEIFKQ